jgi:hypothetical protein
MHRMMITDDYRLALGIRCWESDVEDDKSQLPVQNASILAFVNYTNVIEFFLLLLFLLNFIQKPTVTATIYSETEQSWR